MGLADLHIHTTHSWDGTSTVSAVLKKVVECTDLDVIAITDHDQVRGGFEGMELAPLYGIEVIPGCEISTADGHLLALFIQQLIPRGLSLKETLLRVRDQGGLCIAPHPGARGASSLTPKAIQSALQDPETRSILVGIETYNAGLVYQGSNRVAQQLADELSMAQVGNSDAHMLWMIGTGATRFPGQTAAELRRALQSQATAAVTCSRHQPARLIGHFVSRYLLRKAGWVTGNAGPQAPLRFGRLSQQSIHQPQA